MVVGAWAGHKYPEFCSDIGLRHKYIRRAYDRLAEVKTIHNLRAEASQLRKVAAAKELRAAELEREEANYNNQTVNSAQPSIEQQTKQRDGA